MNITITGTGYVGLVTGVCLAEIGHQVICLDVDAEKVERMKAGISPIFEPGIEDLMKKNIEAGRLQFTADFHEAYMKAEVIYIAVGTPENEDGSANLSFIDEAAKNIGRSIRDDVVIVTKSTVPVGTNKRIKSIINLYKLSNFQVEVVSNPEFLREGSAIHDTFYGDRIVIGAESDSAANLIEEINEPFHIPIVKTDIESAEMIKYASNAFLATKISFINEIASICEKTGANIDDVAMGIGMDSRIGSKFLQAGIGYGGSCFPKDTKALVQIAGDVEHKFELLESVIKVNNNQQQILVKKAKEHLGSLEGKRVAMLGLAFKPNTDDMREAASIVIARGLLAEGAEIIAYDPVAIPNAREILGNAILYANNLEEAIWGADVAMIVTEWDDIKDFPLSNYRTLMKNPMIIDGRNCFSLKEVEKYNIEYISIGRPELIYTKA
ncbi:UDP-glucose dehydrogenase family protein [Bacillus sp. AK128]